MSEHFVKQINIEKYKCFSEFSAEEFKRVNLISGKNNVGKTAFLEALYTNVNAVNIPAMIHGFIFQYLIRHRTENTFKTTDAQKVYESIKNPTTPFKTNSNVNSMSFSWKNTDTVREYEITIKGVTKKISDSDLDIGSIANNYTLPDKKVCYIASVRDDQLDIIRSFTAIQTKDREPDVNKFIQEFDESIENVKIIGGDSLEFKVIGADGNSSYRNIREFGDGLRHYITIISDLFMAEGAYLFIDELDNGIHYSSLDQLWEIILTLSKELNVQVFATTHSRECIESYNRVAQKLEDKDISFTTLVKNKEKVVQAIVRDYELFTNSMHDEREVRGW